MTDTMRTDYRELSDTEKNLIQSIKNQALAIEAMLNGAKPGREISLARTKLEECVMWAVKGITG
jgi:hypothetical protein